MWNCKYREKIAFFLLLLNAAAAFAELSVTFEPPQFRDGLEQIEALIAEHSVVFLHEIKTTLEDSIDKPLFMEGFNRAASHASAITPSIHRKTGFFFSVGTIASLYSETLSPDMFADLENLNEESDYPGGFGVQPLVAHLGVPLDRFIPGISLSLTGGYIRLSSGDLGLETGTLGGQIHWNLQKKKQALFTWDGIALSAGGSWSLSNLSAAFEPGLIEETVEIDPDSRGPLTTLEVAVISLDPVVRAGVATRSINVSMQATTGFTLFGFLSAFAGGSVGWGLSRSAITIDMDEHIVIEGDFQGWIEDSSQGSIAIHGTDDEIVTTTWGFSAIAGLAFRFSVLDITVPVIWRPGKAIGTGLFMGVSL